MAKAEPPVHTCALLPAMTPIGRLPSVDLATIAAFTAAGLSLVSVILSVVLTYRLSRRAQLERWRQDQERPIVARLLKLSDEAASKWLEVNDARMDWQNLLSDDPSQNSGAIKALAWAIESWKDADKLQDKISFEAVQLDLIAGGPVRDVATKLAQRHSAVVLLCHPEREHDDWHGLLSGQLEAIAKLQQDLVRHARTDLGADRRREPRLRSTWQRHQQRRKLAKLGRAYPTLKIERFTTHNGFVVLDRGTGRRAIVAKTIDGLEDLLIDRQVRQERGESPGLLQQL